MSDDPNIFPTVGQTIKAITLYEPWASLMALGEKAIETRSWHNHHRGWIAIHAAKVFTPGMKHVCLQEHFIQPLVSAGLVKSSAGLIGGRIMVDHTFPLGKVVAIGFLSESISVRSGLVREVLASRPREVYYGNYDPGRFAHLFSVMIPLREPVAARGFQGMWDWTIPKGVVLLPHDARWR